MGKKRKISSLALVIILLCVVLSVSFWTMEAHLKPTLLAIAEAKALDMN